MALQSPLVSVIWASEGADDQNYQIILFHLQSKLGSCCAKLPLKSQTKTVPIHVAKAGNLNHHPAANRSLIFLKFGLQLLSARELSYCPVGLPSL